MKDNKKTKKIDKTTVIFVSVVAGILAFVLFFAFALPPISANLKLSETADAFEKLAEDEVVLITDDNFIINNISPTGVEVTLEGSEKQDVIKDLLLILDFAKYRKTEKSLMGSWGIKLSSRGEVGVYTVNLLDDEFYIESDNKRYVFEARDTEAYEIFIERLENIVSERAGK